jgi:exodeoxyribonuclease VII small subunit
MSSHDRDQPALEEVLTDLEEVIGRLTDQNAPLDRLVADYERAGKLLEGAEARFEAVARRVRELQPSLEDFKAQPSTQP